MATYWTIIYQGQERSLADWGLKQVKASFVSADTDTMTFVQCAVDADDPDLFLPRKVCHVWAQRVYDGATKTYSGGVKYFRGRVAERPVNAEGAREQKAYKLLGPWHHLNSTTYEQDFKLVEAFQSPTDPSTPKVLADITSAHVLLNRDVNNLPLCTGEQIQLAVQWVIDRGAPIQMLPDAAHTLNGRTVNVSASFGTLTDVPVDEVQTVSCAEVIRKQMRWVPDLVFWFDYATEPPTIYARRRADLSVVPFSLGPSPDGSPQLVGFNLSPRDDLVKQFVTLQYETSSEIAGSREFSMQRRSWPVVPPTPTEENFEGLVAVVTLAGASLTVSDATVRTEPIPVFGTGLQAQKDFLGEREPGLLTGYVKDYNVISAGRKKGNYNFMLASGDIPPWVGAHSEEDVVTFEVDVTLANGDISRRVIPVNIRATTLDTLGADKTFINASGFPDPEQPPAGLEKDMFDALNPLQYSGELVFRSAEVDKAIFLGNQVSLTGSAQYAGMVATVQSVTQDIDTGQTTVKFGPGPILSAGDYVTLLYVVRGRRVLLPPSTRNPELSSGGTGSVSFGKDTPRDNTSSGANAGFRSVTVVSDTTDGKNKQLRLDAGLHELVIEKSADGLIKITYGDAAGKQYRLREWDVCVKDGNGNLVQKKAGFLSTEAY